MKSVVDHLKVMVRVFRRECHRVSQSERTTVHGADGMLMLLQLAMAQVNKQVNDFKLALILDNKTSKHKMQLLSDVTD